MKRLLTAITFIFIFQETVSAWGFHAHGIINRMACFTLPLPLFGFYKPHLDYLEEHAPDPDRRRYVDPLEAPRHYLDIDHYGSLEAIPFRYEDAACMYGEDTVLAHGTVPWTIHEQYLKLVQAFRRRDEKAILRYSAFLGHYVGDAHVPLHCTSNYDGQQTGQRGIHAFWESRLPEVFSKDYLLVAERADYLQSPLASAWEVLKESHMAVDSVLSFERELNAMTRSDRKFSWEDRGSRVVKVYSLTYSTDYHEMLDGQVEQRMQMAAFRTGCYWYSAWLDAGQPDLPVIQSEKKEEEIIPDTLSPVSWQLRDCGH